MGVGNFYLPNAHTVYISDEQIYGDDEDYEQDQDHRYFRYQDLLAEIQTRTSASFIEVLYDQFEDDCRVIAESGLYLITIREWEGYVAVNVVIKSDILEGPRRGLAEATHWSSAKKLFDALTEVYNLKVRCSAWTSGDYVNQSQTVA